MEQGNLFSNRSMPGCSIIPVLIYEDIEKAIDWLCEAFGFTERWRAGNHRAQLSFRDGAIALSNGSKPDLNSSLDTISARHSLLMRVEDVLAHYEHAKEYGAGIIQPPADYPYGEKQYTAVDIGGHRWTFSQSIADVAPEEWGGSSNKL